MSDTVKTKFEILDSRFHDIKGDQWMERLHTGCRWTEGPATSKAVAYAADPHRHLSATPPTPIATCRRRRRP